MRGLIKWCSDDMYSPESIELLQKSGIDFQRHEEIGILPNDFAELMITSGMVLAPETKWISFHRYVFNLIKEADCILHQTMVSLAYSEVICCGGALQSGSL
jgi:hypothetical protein